MSNQESKPPKILGEARPINLSVSSNTVVRFKLLYILIVLRSFIQFKSQFVPHDRFRNIQLPTQASWCIWTRVYCILYVLYCPWCSRYIPRTILISNTPRSLEIVLQISYSVPPRRWFFWIFDKFSDLLGALQTSFLESRRNNGVTLFFVVNIIQY